MVQTSKPDKKQAILNATLKLLASKGFHGFSMKELAAEAGIATGTVYLYFEDKDSLIVNLHTMIIDAVAVAAFKNINLSLPLKQQYQHICLNIWHFCLSNKCITLSKTQFDHLPTNTLRSIHEEAWSRLKPISDLFEQGRNQGILKQLPDDVLGSFGFEPYVYMANQQLLGIIDINQVELNEMLTASWDAISTNVDQPLSRSYS